MLKGGTIISGNNICLGNFIVKDNVDWHMDINEQNPLVKAYRKDKSKNLSYLNKRIREYIVSHIEYRSLFINIDDFRNKKYILMSADENQIKEDMKTGYYPELAENILNTLYKSSCTWKNGLAIDVNKIEFYDNDLIDDMVQQFGCALVLTANKKEPVSHIKAEVCDEKKSLFIRETVNRQGYYAFNNYAFLIKRPGNYSAVFLVCDVPQEYLLDWIKVANNKRYLRTPEPMVLKRMANLKCSDKEFFNLVNFMSKYSVKVQNRDF